MSKEFWWELGKPVREERTVTLTAREQYFLEEFFRTHMGGGTFEESEFERNLLEKLTGQTQ